MKHDAVSKHMARCGSLIAPGETVATATARLREGRVSYLPVAEEGCLFGVLSASVVRRAESVGDSDSRTIDELVLTEVHAVEPSEPIGSVCRTLLDLDCEVAVVVEGETILGVFTSDEALGVLAFAESVADRTSPSPGDGGGDGF